MISEHASPLATLGGEDSGGQNVYVAELARRLGVVSKHDGAPLRTTFLIDPDRTIRWACAYDQSIERTASDVLRVLDGLAPASRIRYSTRETARLPQSKPAIQLEAAG